MCSVFSLVCVVFAHHRQEALSDLSERAAELAFRWWRWQDVNLRPSGRENRAHGRRSSVLSCIGPAHMASPLRRSGSSSSSASVGAGRVARLSYEPVVPLATSALRARFDIERVAMRGGVTAPATCRAFGQSTRLSTRQVALCRDAVGVVARRTATDWCIVGVWHAPTSTSTKNSASE